MENEASHGARIGELVRAFAAALLSGDEVAAEQTIRDAMDAGLTTAQIDDEVIAPALWHVGELWERGEITVGDEHIATEICVRVLALQREARRVARARAEHLVMLATPEGERHVVALRMVDNLLREAGYQVAMLGPDVPHDALARCAGRLEADVVCMSSTVRGGGDQVLIALHEVQRSLPAVGFVLGGAGLASRVRPGPGVAVCRSVSEAVEAVDAIVKRAEMN